MGSQSWDLLRVQETPEGGGSQGAAGRWGSRSSRRQGAEGVLSSSITKYQPQVNRTVSAGCRWPATSPAVVPAPDLSPPILVLSPVSPEHSGHFREGRNAQDIVGCLAASPASAPHTPPTSQPQCLRTLTGVPGGEQNHSGWGTAGFVRGNAEGLFPKETKEK